MTARDFLAAALRRWYVVVLGAALTVGVFAVVQRQAPVFFTQYNIVVIGPSGTEHDNNVLENPRYGLQPLVVPPSVQTQVMRLGAEFVHEQPDHLTNRLVLRLPRVFLTA